MNLKVINAIEYCAIALCQYGLSLAAVDKK
jgi:hypothetical protein